MEYLNNQHMPPEHVGVVLPTFLTKSLLGGCSLLVLLLLGLLLLEMLHVRVVRRFPGLVLQAVSFENGVRRKRIRHTKKDQCSETIRL